MLRVEGAVADNTDNSLADAFLLATVCCIFMLETVVEARGLTKVYGSLKERAVDGIDFAVRRGDTFGLLGPNGAGKSTTMRMIACRSPLTDGELFVEGLDVRSHA